MGDLADSSNNTDSRTVTEQKLRDRRYEENLLVDKIVNHEATLKEIVLKIAQSIEERYNMLDPDFDPNFTLNQISSIISRQLRNLGVKVANCVYQYLPEKYKNMKMARERKLLEQEINVIELCEVELCKPIGELTNSNLETSLEAVIKAKKLNDDLGTRLNNTIEDIRAEGLLRGISLLEEKYRDQISARDYRYEIPDYFGLKELNQEVVDQGNRMIRALIKFFNEKYVQCPATVRQDAFRYANAIRVSANMYEAVNEDKWSGELEFWFDREYWKNVQSSHKAGNSTMFPTTLCAYCSKNVGEDPKDFHRMKYWRPSPTGYLCDCCGGTQVLLRENTREQVGDRQAFILRNAADIMEHIEDYPIVWKDWRDRYKNPEIYARKAAIHDEFEDAAFGKSKIVVQRKKLK